MEGKVVGKEVKKFWVSKRWEKLLSEIFSSSLIDGHG